MKLKFPLFLFIILSVLSCQSSLQKNAKSNLLLKDMRENSIKTYSVLDSTEIVKLNLIDKFIKVSSLLDINKIIYLDSASLIGVIDKVIYSNDMFFVMDQAKSEKISCFNKEGKFLFNAGSKGRGPKEYLALYDMTINPYQQELLVYDGKRVLYFDLKGNFLKKRRIDLFGKNLSVIDNRGTLLFCMGNTIYNDDLKYNLIAVDTNNTVKSMNLPFRERESQLNEKLVPLFFFDHNYTNTYYTESYNDTIYEINENSIWPKYIMDYQQYSMPEKDKGKSASERRSKNPKSIDHMTVTIQNDSTLFVLNSGFFNHFIFTFYNKKSKASKSFSEVANDILGPAVQIFPIGIFEDKYFIIPVEPSIIHMIYKEGILKKLNKEQIKEFNQSEETKTFREILNRTNENSNPVLLIAKIKNQFYEQ